MRAIAERTAQDRDGTTGRDADPKIGAAANIPDDGGADIRYGTIPSFHDIVALLVEIY